MVDFSDITFLKMKISIFVWSKYDYGNGIHLIYVFLVPHKNTDKVTTLDVLFFSFNKVK